MSVKAMAWAYEQRVGHAVRKSVLIALADAADDTGLCWPSIKRIAWMAEVNERTVQRHVRDLEAMGLLAVDRSRVRDNGASSSNAYQLPIHERPLFSAKPERAARSRKGGEGDNLSPPGNLSPPAGCRGEGGSSVTPIQKLEPSLEPSLFGGAVPAEGLPAGIPRDLWAEFLALRKKKRAPLTGLAQATIFQKLAEFEAQGQSPAAVLMQSIECGYTTVYPLKSPRRPESRHADLTERNRAAAEEARRRIEERMPD